MDREQPPIARTPAYTTRNRVLQSTQKLRTCRGRVTISLGFYLGIGMLILLLVGGAFVGPSSKPLSTSMQILSRQPAYPSKCWCRPAVTCITWIRVPMHTGIQSRSRHRKHRGGVSCLVRIASETPLRALPPW